MGMIRRGIVGSLCVLGFLAPALAATLTISPASESVPIGGTRAFVAVLAGSPTSAVTWFVNGVPGNKSDIAVCQAVAGIARSLGLGLGAEGIERDAQRQFLLELGVPIGQGFLFAPGLRADEFARRLDQDRRAHV